MLISIALKSPTILTDSRVKSFKYFEIINLGCKDNFFCRDVQIK